MRIFISYLSYDLRNNYARRAAIYKKGGVKATLLLKLNNMKNIFFISLIALSLNQNGCDKGKCQPSRGSKDWAEVTLKDGNISTNENLRRATLISVTRTMKGQKHLFIADTGDSIVRFYNTRLCIGECYYLKVS